MVEKRFGCCSFQFLYKEHEVQSINSSPMWNVDLTEWDGIEVEVIDESDLISDLQEVIIDLRFSVPSLLHLYMEHEVNSAKIQRIRDEV